jgi:exopolysaccharide biosynthesis polyprenyl glycosylphosphotransferase
MGRALSRYMPLNISILWITEFALSIAVVRLNAASFVVHGSLPVADPLPVGVTSAAFQDGELAVVIAFLVGGMIGITRVRWPQSHLDRKRLLAAVCVAGIIPVIVLLSQEISQGQADVRSLQLREILPACLGTLVLFCLYCKSTLGWTLTARRVLIIGEAARTDAIGVRLQSRRGRRFKALTGDAAIQSGELLQQQRVWGVIIASGAESLVSERLLDYKLRGLRVIGDKAFQERYLCRIDLDTLTIDDLLLAEGFVAGRTSAAVKRGCDLAISAMMLILTLPIMALAALAIRLDSPGPVLYRQRRIGRLGQPFTLLKFRSMTVDAEAGDKPCWAQRQDPRITRVGAVMRAARVDELPQLVNVIRGEMSLVGPRPERPHFVEQLVRAIPFYRERSYAKPGLTGWAQVNFRYGASVEDAREKLAYDLYYAKHRGLLLDLFILVSTIRVVLFREGAR